MHNTGAGLLKMEKKQRRGDVLQCSVAIKPSFCIASEPRKKHVSMILYLRRNNSQTNELKEENRLQREQRRLHLLERSWHQFFGMVSLIFFKNEKQSTASIT